MKVAGLFAGIGGLELGLHDAGHSTELFCEIKTEAAAVLRARFPGVPVAPEFNPPPFGQPLSATPPAAPGGSAQRKPTGFEKEYGHVL